MLERANLRQIIITLTMTGVAMIMTAESCQAAGETAGTSPSAMSRRYHYTNEFARDAYEADRRSLRPRASQDNPYTPGSTNAPNTPEPPVDGQPSPSPTGPAPKSQAQQSGPATSTPGNGEEFKLPYWTEHANQKDDHPGPCRGCASPVFRIVKGVDVNQTDSFRSAYMATAFHGLPEGRKPFEGYGIPLTDTSFYAMMKQVSERKLAILNDPMNLMITAKGKNQTQVQLASAATADAAESSFDTNIECLRTPMINVANENAGVPTTTNQPSKGVENAVWMVQKMYKSLYLPMAVLLLLPGAVLTQARSMVGAGILGQSDGDGVNPFSGILRSIIALFLIPCTQLIVSYSVDVGNSLTFEIADHLDPTEMLQWAHQQTFDAPMQNARNIYMEPQTQLSFTPMSFLSLSVLLPGAPNPAIFGVTANGPEQASEVEQQSFTSQTIQMIFNLINMGFSIGLSMLLSFQTVMMCYLFLLGPIAAALFAWPSGIGVNVNNAGSLFQRVFSNWLDAVMTLALWRFWWCIVILVMATRIAWLQEIGGYEPNSQWEVLMYTAFMIILTTVPFLPFDFRPGDMASKALDKASSAANSSGGADDGGGGDQQRHGDKPSGRSKQK
jgi:hypothetical protein